MSTASSAQQGSNLGPLPSDDINQIPHLNKKVQKLRLHLELIRENPQGQLVNTEARVRAELSQAETTLEQLKQKAVAMRQSLLRGGCF
jgi:hypothetical protein